MKTAISTALWGPEDSPYVRYSIEFVHALGAQTNQNFDIISHVSENLIPVIKQTFQIHASSILEQERLKIFPLTACNPNILNAAVERFDYFCDPSNERRYDRVALLDYDDIPSPNFIETTAGTMDKSGADIVVVDFHLIGREKPYQPVPYFSQRFENGQWIDFNAILHGNCIAFSNVLVTPAVLKMGNYKKFSSFPEIMYGAPDWAVFLPAIAKGAKAVFTDEAHILYRQHENLSGITLTDAQAVERALRLKTFLYNHCRPG